MASEQPEKQTDEILESSGSVLDEGSPNKDKPDISAHDLQAIIASLLQKEHGSAFSPESGYSFNLTRGPQIKEMSLEDSIKLSKLKAKKARKQNRIRDKNVAKTFNVEAKAGNDKAYDLDAVLKFLGEVPAPASKNKK